MRQITMRRLPSAAALGLAAFSVCATAPAWAERPGQDRPPLFGEPDAPGRQERRARPETPGPHAQGPHAKAPDGKGRDMKGEAKPELPLKGKADTSESRAKLLADLYAHLAAAEDEARAQTVTQGIERLWLNSGSDTISLLMERSVKAASQKKTDLALNLLNAVVNLAPDYAEGFNRRAYIFYSENNLAAAMGDLRRVLALDPSHYKALEGVALIFKETGNKKAALKAYEELLRVHPFASGAKEAVKELRHEVEGRGI